MTARGWSSSRAREARGASNGSSPMPIDARGPDPLARVIARLRDAEAILLLDACEHALAEAARVASAVLPECPGVRVLATSREVLHLAGEVPVTLKPLQAPERGSDRRRRLAGGAAVCRARTRGAAGIRADRRDGAARRRDRPSGGRAPARDRARRRAHQACSGSPSSARSSSAASRCSVIGRHPTRSAPPSWGSWSGATSSCTRDEKTLLHQLAVHRGGASLSSLLAVAANDGLDEATVNHLLAALVDKSIISVSFPDEEARYDLLDTVRDYALERLAESGGLAAARKAHAEYFATLADAARPGLRGSEWFELGQASRARQRQPLGRPRLRARHARPRRRDLAWRVAGRVLRRSPSASPRAASTSSSRSRLPRTTRRSTCESSCWRGSASSPWRSSTSTPRSRRANGRLRSPTPLPNRSNPPWRGRCSRSRSPRPATISGRRSSRKRRERRPRPATMGQPPSCASPAPWPRWARETFRRPPS